MPDGVSKLRGLILQLAVQGKLVPQDANDEPVAVLLEKINIEKERLVKEKKIRKSKPLPPVEMGEILFEIPESWKWIRLNQIGDWGAGATPNRAKSEYYGGSIRWLKSGELRDGYVSESDEKITESALKDCSLRVNKCGDVLIAMYGATIGKVAILEVEATTNQAVCACTCFAGFYNRYLFLLLQAYKQHFSNQGAGGAQPNISRTKIINTVAPLPPIEEQKRIVTKVDQLMALCDELEARQQKKQEARLRLNSAALDKLLTAHEPAEFAHHWQRVCDNFDLLYDNPETVGELRKAILQLAVQGRLVQQDPNDEPAEVLLEKIKAEKERLVKEGEIRKQKAFPPVKGSDGLFELPESWQWDRFVNVILSSEAGWSPQCEKREREGNEWGVLKVSAVSWDVFKPHENKALPSKLEPRSQHEVKVGDFLISRANTLELVAKSIVVEDSPPKLMMSDKLIRLHLSENVERRFFNIFNNCSTARGYYAKEASGTSSSMRNVSRECILKMPVPVPPVEEQKRIVSRVDQLMTLCDDLEAKLRQSQTDGGILMGAVVHKLVAA